MSEIHDSSLAPTPAMTGFPLVDAHSIAFTEGFVVMPQPISVGDAPYLAPEVVAPEVVLPPLPLATSVGTALALIKDGVESKRGDWSLTLIKTANLTERVAEYVDSGRISADQAATAIALAESPKQLMKVLDTSADYRMHVAVASQLVVIADGEKSSLDRVAANFKTFHAARFGEGMNDVEVQETVEPALLPDYANSVEASLKDYETLSGVWSTYSRDRNMAISFPLAIKLYEVIGSVDEVEGIFNALAESDGSPSDIAVAHRILTKLKNSDGFTFDVQDFIADQRSKRSE